MEQLLLLHCQQAGQIASSPFNAAVQHLLNCWTALWAMAGTPNLLLLASHAMPFAQLVLEQVQKCFVLLPSDVAADAAVAQCELLSDSASVDTAAGSYGSNTNSSSIQDMRAACSNFWEAAAREALAPGAAATEAQDAIMYFTRGMIYIKQTYWSKWRRPHLHPQNKQLCNSPAAAMAQLKLRCSG